MDKHFNSTSKRKRGETSLNIVLCLPVQKENERRSLHGIPISTTTVRSERQLTPLATWYIVTLTLHKSTVALNCLSVELLSTALSYISGNYATNIHSILYNYAMDAITQHIHVAMQITRVSSLLCFKSPVSLLVKPSSSAVNLDGSIYDRTPKKLQQKVF